MRLKVSRQTVSDLLHEKKSVTAEMKFKNNPKLTPHAPSSLKKKPQAFLQGAYLFGSSTWLRINRKKCFENLHV
jgi:hypothetical protein